MSMDEGEIDRVCAVWPDAEFKKLPNCFQKLPKYYPKHFFTLIDNFINSQKVKKSFWATFESEFVDNVYKEKSFVLKIWEVWVKGAVWPYLTKFLHFGQNFKLFGHLKRLYLVFGKK